MKHNIRERAVFIHLASRLPSPPKNNQTHQEEKLPAAQSEKCACAALSPVTRFLSKATGTHAAWPHRRGYNKRNLEHEHPSCCHESRVLCLCLLELVVYTEYTMKGTLHNSPNKNKKQTNAETNDVLQHRCTVQPKKYPTLRASYSLNNNIDSAVVNNKRWFNKKSAVSEGSLKAGGHPGPALQDLLASSITMSP